jgi:predicted nucleic acid-binding protein
MPKEILADSGPLIALFHEKDFYHKKVLYSIQNNDFLLTTTWPVITEVFYFLSSYKGKTQLFLEWIERGGLEIHDLFISDLDYIKKRILKYSDVPMDLADASLICIAERESVYKIISIDSDFEIYKLNNGKYLENVLNL